MVRPFLEKTTERTSAPGSTRTTSAGRPRGGATRKWSCIWREGPGEGGRGKDPRAEAAGPEGEPARPTPPPPLEANGLSLQGRGRPLIRGTLERRGPGKDFDAYNRRVGNKSLWRCRRRHRRQERGAPAPPPGHPFDV